METNMKLGSVKWLHDDVPEPLPGTGDEEIDAFLKQCVETFRVKGNDYIVGSADRLYNFREGAKQARIPMEKVWFVYFWKHWCAIQRWINDGKVDSEGVEGRIMDAVVYLTLLLKMVKEKARVAEDASRIKTTSTV